MLGSIYYMTLKLFCNSNLDVKTSRFCHIYTRCYGRYLQYLQLLIDFNLVYILKKIVGTDNFSAQFIKIRGSSDKAYIFPS